MRNKILIAGAVAALLVTTARANTITPILISTGPVWTYGADLTSGQIQTGDGFTIYDFGGFAGFGTIAAGWTATSTVVGSPHQDGTFVVTTPDTSDANLHFTYGGPTITIIFGSAAFIPFEVFTTSLGLVSDSWVSRDHTLATGNPQSPTVGGSIIVASHVPDGGITVMLLGGALAGFGLLRRKFVA